MYHDPGKMASGILDGVGDCSFGEVVRDPQWAYKAAGSILARFDSLPAVCILPNAVPFKPWQRACHRQPVRVCDRLDSPCPDTFAAYGRESPQVRHPDLRRAFPAMLHRLS